MLSREECRAADRVAIETYKIPSLVLMENAGRNCAEHLIWHSHQHPRDEQAVVVLCGPGNNGGDGFVIARHLYNAGFRVKAVLFQRPESYAGEPAVNLNAISRFRMPVVEFDESWNVKKLAEVFGEVKRKPTTWVVDALLGTGAKGELRSNFAKAIELSNAMDVRRLAVDMPTGLDCDSGIPAATTFRADLTCTFIDSKVGFENSSAAEFLGMVTVVEIGAPDEIVRSK